MKWLTSGSHRLKANLNRSFGARKTKKAAAGKKDIVRHNSIVSSSKGPKCTRTRSKSSSRLTRGKDITRTELLGCNPPMLSSDGYRDFNFPTTVDATEMDKRSLRQDHRQIIICARELGHAISESFRPPHFAHEKKESTRIQRVAQNRIRTSNYVHNRFVVDHHQLRNDIFDADSIEQIIALQEQHRQREIEQRPREDRICCDDIQLTVVEHPCQRNEQYLRQTANTKRGRRDTVEQWMPVGDMTPTIDNTRYQSQPLQQTLRFFNHGVEVDMSGIPLT
jgi:hypothetical protein